MIRYKNSLISLGKGEPVSARAAGGECAFVISNGNALLKRTIKKDARAASPDATIVSYAEACVLLENGVVEYAGEVRYEPRDA